ncbi:hypothetical protein L914_01199, partial [Phytophthora nicotianae]
CEPRGFYESLIVMVDNPAPNMFTPVYLVLYTSKAETMYEAILHLIHRDTGKRCLLLKSSAEFSQILSAQSQCPNTEVVRCFIHFKHAIRGRLKKERLMEDKISIAMESGVLDTLSVIDSDLVDPKDIA